MLFGLQAYKPHLALMIPVALLAGRQWRAIAAAAVTVGVLLLASIALAGLRGLARFPRSHAAAAQGHARRCRRGVAPQRVGVHGGARGSAPDSPPPMRCRRGGADRGRAGRARVVQGCARAARNAAVLIGVLLATPYLQDYDLVLGAFIVVWLAGMAHEPGAQIASALILLLPLLASPLAKLTGFAFGPLFVVPALVVTARAIFALSRSRRCSARVIGRSNPR